MERTIRSVTGRQWSSPLLGGFSGVVGGKVLPSGPGFGYNPHNGRPAVQFNPSCSAGPLVSS
jgi:hypothetical protein